MSPASHPYAVYPVHCKNPVGKQIRDVYGQRISQFIDDNGQFSSKNLPAKYYNAVIEDSDLVDISAWSAPGQARPKFSEVILHGRFKPAVLGEKFGPSWTTHWFKIKLTIPSKLLYEDRLEFHWDCEGEAMVWSKDGEPLQGLSPGERTSWILPDSFRNQLPHEFFIEVACNGMFGNPPNGNIVLPPDEDRMFTLKTARIVSVNMPARDLYFDYRVISEAFRAFPPDSKTSHDALQTCNAIMDTFIASNGDNETLLKCRGIARGLLGDKIDSEEVYNTDRDSFIYGVGHCHIDTCWLWPFAETHRKIARSWSNQCALMERYPEHRFTCSSAQQYKWLKQDYPSVFERVRHWIERGAFQYIGGSWVEHDTNIPSGESLCRQFLYGQRFFESNFGERCKTFWLPDTFGYSGQLPQLCRLAGMSRFFTQKISWNNINKFPHTTFNWVGLDNSQVLCHMAPAESYSSEATLDDMLMCVNNHGSLDQDASSLYVFGKGDGGGGPTWEHLEQLRRLRGLADTNESLPRIRMGNSVEDFYDRLQQKALDKKTVFATWYGELYLELHRGTYTTQAHNKSSNRRVEFMLRDLEFLATFASLKNPDYKFPKNNIDEMWENVMLCQFHDCLPGSCIRMCYDDSDRIYRQVFAKGAVCRNEVLSALGFSSDGENGYGAINTMPWSRSEIVKVSGNDYALVSGQPGFSRVTALSSTAAAAVTVEKQSSGVFLLTNKNFAVSVKNGAIISLVDLRQNREIISRGGKANRYLIYDDKPIYWQAWDVEVYHLRSAEELPMGETVINESGPHRVSVVTETKISEISSMKSTISLSAVTDDESYTYVEIENDVEWHEKFRFLKVEFDVDIHNNEASYEMQYGFIRRPTHYNTSWDMAKFEVCHHKWADLSEHGYGVSILNDNKFGFATSGNKMRLSLLRSPKAPDATADMGQHKIRYAIFPHAGPLDERTVRAGYNFNNRLVIEPRLSRVPSDVVNLLGTIQLDGDPSLVLDWIKRGEDDEDVSVGDFPTRPGRSVLVRIFDSLGGKSHGTIRVDKGLGVKRAFRCNILEDDLEELPLKDGQIIPIEHRAFEISTYRLQL